MILVAASEGGLPNSIFTPLYTWLMTNQSAFMKSMGFDVADKHLGQVWFEGLCFSILACGLLITLAFLATSKLARIPRGLQGLFEIAVSGFRSMVHGMTGPMGDKYVPFIGTCFLFIFFMNLLGVFPAGRSATMALSITAGMGVTAFILVQYYCFRDAGPVAIMKHLAGPVWWLAPLIFCAELLSELVRPVTLSMRLYGNIYGEDNVIEAFLHLATQYTGGWIPFQAPILLLSLLTAFLQAYIFSMLCTYYIASKVVHEEGHGEEHAHGDEHHKEKAHAHGH